MLWWRLNVRPDKMHLFPDFAAVAVCCHELIENLGSVRHSLRYIIWKPSIVYLLIFQLGFKPCPYFSFYFLFFFYSQGSVACLPAALPAWNTALCVCMKTLLGLWRGCSNNQKARLFPPYSVNNIYGWIAGFSWNHRAFIFSDICLSLSALLPIAAFTLKKKNDRGN